MSTTTDVLSLFKYDPVADADSTFNITQALNNNWDKLDAAILLAIAAAGAYNPEESYAVGDYCTYKGKLRKCSTAIPTGETWTEAHWTTTTVAAEMQELSSQLSNLAGSKQDGFVRKINSGEDLDVFIEYGSYYITSSDAPFVINAPIQSAFMLFVSRADDVESVKRSVQIAVKARVTASEIRVRWHNDFGWSPWHSIVLAAPPQEFDLPLAEGIGNSAKYSKDQLGRVQLRGWITGATADTVVATLPAGFRPASAAHFIQAISSSSQCGIARVVVRSDGTIYVELPQNGTLANGLSLQLSFLAG